MNNAPAYWVKSRFFIACMIKMWYICSKKICTEISVRDGAVIVLHKGGDS